MPSTVAQLAERVVRKLGLAVVVEADRPASGSPLTAAEIAARALRAVGENAVASGSATAPGGTTTPGAIANRVLQKLGLDPVVVGSKPTTATVNSVAGLAERVLRQMGVNQIGTASDAPLYGTCNMNEIAWRVLRRLAIIDAFEPIPPAEEAQAVEKAEATMQSLYALGIIADPLDMVLEAHAEYVVILAANLLAPSYGLAQDPVTTSKAMDTLRLIALSKDKGQVLAEIEVNAAHQALVSLGYVSTTIAAGIPEAVGTQIVIMAAARLGPAYGKPADDAAWEGAVQVMRRYVMSGPVGLGLAQERVVSVHEMLAGMSLVTWDSAAIPDYAEEAYVDMAADMLAPLLGLPGDQAAYDGAMASIRRFSVAGAAGQTLAEARVVEVHEALNGAGLVEWPVTAVPLTEVEAYVAMTASLLAPIYNVGQDAAGREVWASTWRSSFASVRRSAIVRRAPELASQKIMAVHQAYAARGRVRWTIWDIPVYVEEPYVLLAASIMAPECDVKADPSWAVQGDQLISQFIALGSSGERVAAEYF